MGTTHACAGIPEGFDSPFAYSSLTHLSTLWLVAPDAVASALGRHAEHVTPVGADGRALVSVAYQSYLADYGSAAVISRELEIGPVVVPYGAEPPDLAGYLYGGDQRGVAGIWPTAVYCDCDPAINAGRAIYGEPKFEARFEVDVPAPNAPSATWAVNARSGERTVQLEVELNASGQLAASDPVVNLGFREDLGQIVASRWDIHVPEARYEPQAVVRANFDVVAPDGSPGSFPGLAAAECVLVTTHGSPPVARRSRPYFVAAQPPRPTHEQHDLRTGSR